MRAAVALMPLTLALFAALPDHPQSDQGHSDCEDSPLIRMLCRHDESSKYDRQCYIGWAKGENKVSIAYGFLLDVFCGHPKGENADKITMKRNGEKLVTRKNYINVIQSARTQVLTPKDVFVCTDVESTCASSIIISVTPAFEVISHNLQTLIDNDNHVVNYSVQYGEPVTVLCLGPDATRLVMSQDGEPLLTGLESNTTIKHFVKQTDLLISEYVCTDMRTSKNNSVTIKVLPAVQLQSQNETITPSWVNNRVQFYSRAYKNSDVEVHCFGPRTVQLIGRGEDNIPFTDNLITVNPHRVKYIIKLKLGKWYFECSESEFPDYVTRVEILIKPWIRRVGSREDTSQYVIKYGDTIEIICSGPDSDELHIEYARNYAVGFKNKGIEVTLNTTAIKYTLKETGMDNKFSFWCTKQGCPLCIAELYSISVLPADVADFRCVSHDGLILNCTWTAQSSKVNFTLSYVANAILTRICATPRSSKKSKICILDYEYNDEQAKIKDLVLLLQSCNSAGCSNQTFHIDHLSIVKPAPVRNLRVFDIKPRGAHVRWFGSGIQVAGEWFSDHQNDFHHRVQYWYSGIEPREVNASLMTCSSISLDCEIELHLPCPGQFYEVWVYRKLKRTVGEEYWSDPTSVSFHTVGDENTTKDATCNWTPRKKPAVMEYFVQEHKKELHLEMQAFKEKLISLKDQLDTLRALKQQGKGTP